MKKFFEEFKEFASSFLSDVVNFIFMKIRKIELSTS